eukprot:m.123668 g.123668  ORF g.123668 m.123668 type:complete len:91 (-) comp11130_c0_seq13:1666-1938(-)
MYQLYIHRQYLEPDNTKPSKQTIKTKYFEAAQPNKKSTRGTILYTNQRSLHVTSPRHNADMEYVRLFRQPVRRHVLHLPVSCVLPRVVLL